MLFCTQAHMTLTASSSFTDSYSAMRLMFFFFSTATLIPYIAIPRNVFNIMHLVKRVFAIPLVKCIISIENS